MLIENSCLDEKFMLIALQPRASNFLKLRYNPNIVSVDAYLTLLKPFNKYIQVQFEYG